jgi:hypothetical protein
VNRCPACALPGVPGSGGWVTGSEADEERLIAAFTAGTSKRKLAERFGISESSVERLIRQHGASKPSPAPSASR